MFPAIISPFSY